MANIFKKVGKWAKKQYGGGLSMQGVKSSLKGAVKPQNLGYTLGALTLGATAIPGVGIGGLTGLASKIPGAGKLASVGKFALDNKDLIVSGLGAAQGLKDDKRSRALMNEAIEMQRQRQMMAGQAADRIGGLQRPDLSSLYDDPANPYRKPRIPAVGGY